jgi:hypothetical protein
MSKTIKCPSCGKPTEVPAFEGDGTFNTCGCPTGQQLAKVYRP